MIKPSFNTNPYVAEAVDRLGRTLFFYLLIGLCGLMLAVMHDFALGTVSWFFMLTTMTIYRIQKLRQIERSSYSEEEAAPIFAKILYFSGILSGLFCLLFLDKFEQTLASVVSMGVMLLVVSGPIIAPSFIFRERKIDLGAYFLIIIGVFVFSWLKTDHPVAEFHILGVIVVCVLSYIKVISNLSTLNGIDMLSIEGAVSLQKVEREIETTQLQVAQMSHNIRQTVQALNFQLEDAGGDRDSLRRQLGLMDKFLVRLQNMGQSNGRSGAAESKHVTEIGDLVGDAMEIFRTLALNKGIQFSKSGSLTYIQIPPEELYFILCNLMSNTIRHSKGSKASVTWVELEDFVEISYQDNGVGFQPSQILEIGDIESRKFGVESIEATLSARGIQYFWDWNQNPGMKFCFYIEKMPRASMKRGSFCIVLEDDLMAGEWMSRRLTEKFEKVVVVRSLVEAIISSEEHGFLPNLVITDLSLGGNSWKIVPPPEYVKKLRILFEAPVLVVTGDIATSQQSCGANRVLHKPIDRSELILVVNSVLTSGRCSNHSDFKEACAA